MSDSEEEAEEALARQRALQWAAKAKYRARHPDKVAAAKRRYREKHPAKIAEAKAKYQARHADKVAVAKQRYQEKHWAKLAEAAKRYYYTHLEQRRSYDRQRYQTEHRRAYITQHRAKNRVCILAKKENGANETRRNGERRTK